MPRPDNYHSDHRVRARERRSLFEHVDHGRMLATIVLDDGEDGEPIQVPIKFDVCPTCDGRGTHVNPSIDCDGLSADDFADDPDFMDSYMNGAYDVGCYECGGARVVPVIRPDWLEDPKNKAVVDLIEKREEEEESYRRTVEAERRFGC